ncbi:MAG: hypothetical protein WA733_25600 [Methylocystis sp.]
MQAHMAAPRRVIEESWPPSKYLDSIASDEWPACCPILSDQTPACAALVVNSARRLHPGEVGSIDARCPGSSRFRQHLAKRKDQFLEFGFGYPFGSSHPRKPLRHALVHF